MAQRGKGESMRKALQRGEATKRLAVIAAMVAAALALCLLAGFSDASPVKKDVNSYSWSELSAISQEISEAENDDEGREIAQKYHIVNSSGKIDGSQTKSITLSDGTQTKAIVAGIRADSTGKGKAGITFVFADAVAVQNMNETASNTDGWAKSGMRTWLNEEFEDKLPSDLKKALLSVNKKTNTEADSNPGNITSTSDKLWLPSVIEVSGSVSKNNMPAHGKYSADVYNAEGSQYELFKNKGIVVGEGNDSLVRKCLVDTDSGLVKQGEPSVWWLRSLSMDWNAGFAAVTAEGDPYSSWFSDYALGVVPGFCV